MRIEDTLRNSSRLFPDKVAVVADAHRLTYRELDAATDRFAVRLSDLGVQNGDRVVVVLDNSIDVIIGLYGALKAGAVFSPVNPSTKSDKLSFILDNCRAAAVVTDRRRLPVVRAAAARLDGAAPAIIVTDIENSDIVDVVPFRDAGEEIRVMPSTGNDEELALLIYTSGSTGRPKGVMMTHRNVEAAATSIIAYLENTSNDVILNVLPLSFDYGLYQVLMSVQVGARLVLEKSFAFPQKILERLASEEVTGFPLVPTMAAMLVNMKSVKSGRFPALRYITNTAAALPPDHIKRLNALFPGTDIYSMYGLTECKRCTWLPPAELERRPDSVGIAIPGTKAEVVDEDGFPVPAGVVGELVVQGPHVMRGYWENAQATEAVLRPDPRTGEIRLHTGDLFTSDADGFLYFVGRSDDIIKSRGEKVSPKEIENVLYELPGIVEAAVVATPDPVLGSAITAVISTDGAAELSARDVQHHCARNLEDFMVPKYVEFRDALPKTATGKINRRLVAEGALEAAE